MKHRLTALALVCVAAAALFVALRSGAEGEPRELGGRSAEQAPSDLGGARSEAAPDAGETTEPRLARRAELPLLARCIDAATRSPLAGVAFAVHAERPPTGLEALRAKAETPATLRLASEVDGELRAALRAGKHYLELDDPRWVGGALHEVADPAQREAPTLELVRAGAVRGRVLAPEGTQLAGPCRVFALPGVALYLEQPALLHRVRSALCDADGAFEIGGLAPAEGWQLCACATGFEATRSAQAFAVRAGERSSCDVELPVPRTISGRVVDGDGTAIAKALVVLSLEAAAVEYEEQWKLDRPWSWGVATRVEAESDAQGRFRFHGLPRFGFSVWALVPGFGPSKRFEWSFAGDQSGEPPEIELVLTRGRALRGRVLDAEGVPVEGARIDLAQVAAQIRPDARSWSTLSAADGSFAFADLPSLAHDKAPEKDLVRGEVNAFGLCPLDIHQRFPAQGELELRLPPGAPHVIRFVTRGTGAPVTQFVFEFDVEGDEVMVKRWIEVRSETGSFRPPRSHAGERFRVHAEGHLTLEQAWHTLDGGDQVIELEPLPVLRGRVVDEEERPIEGALIRDSDDPRVVASDARGGFELPRSRNHGFVLLVQKDGFLPATFDEDDQSTEEIVVNLERGGSLRGVVRTTDGVPASDRAVLLSRDEPPLCRLARSDERGMYRFEGLASGSYELGVLSPDTPLDALELRRLLENVAVIVSPQETVVDLVDAPKAPASLRGQVVDLDGAPVPHAKVELWIELALGRLQTARPELATETDAEGRFDFPALPAGDAWITYGTADEEQEAHATLDEGQSIELLLALGGGAITGRVLAEESDLPLAGLELDCFPEGEMAVVVAEQTVETDAEGRFAFLDLPLGTYTVRARTERAERFGARKVELRPGAAQQQLELRLARGAALEVQVRGVDGQPIEVQEVWVHTSDGARESLHGGPLRFAEHVPAGRCEISTTGDGGAFAIQELELRAGETRHLQLQLSRGASLAFDVRDESGSPCGLAELELERVSAPGHTAAFAFQLARCDFEVDGRGQSNTERVPAGRYRARAQRGSQRSELVEFELEDGQKRRVALIVR
ncbi:MAG: carboxypeptidase regulatory-like domain-containing protein [Planctomycetes bacterium]|nr:carboxypeptidase regulatory-like domain-containing protein [Planctomycetota bacterium]